MLSINEEWKDVPEHPGYQASTQGRVRVVERVVRYQDGRVYVYPAKILDTWEGGPARGKYLYVTVDNKNWRLNRLILMTFNGPPPFPGAEARHLDGDRHNNRPGNLCWGTRRENVDDTIRHGRTTKGEKHPMVKVTEEIVRHIRQLRDSGMSTAEIGRKVGLSQTHVSGICVRRYWKHVV